MVLLSCKNIPSDQYFLALATDTHALQEFEDVNQIDIVNEPNTVIEYSNENPANLFDESTLNTNFKPKVLQTDIAEQAKLHKSDEVVGYDSTFEKLNKKYLKHNESKEINQERIYYKKYLIYKNKYLQLKNKLN
jgi:hypothetical protein